MNKIIDIYYFSGTGNTLLVVNKMAGMFREQGKEVNLFRIEASDPSQINLSNTIGLAFPVAVQSTYKFIWDFFKGLPKGNGAEIFMVDTMHSYSGAVVGPLKRFLLNRAYKPIGAKEIPMPMNIFPPKINKNKNDKKIEKGLKIAVEYAKSLINGKAKWGRVPILSDINFFIMNKDFWWILISKFGRKFKFHKDKCIKCGLCSRLCPVKNISMNEYPVFDSTCQLCMRCVMFCPKEAIDMPLWKYERYHQVGSQELLK